MTDCIGGCSFNESTTIGCSGLGLETGDDTKKLTGGHEWVHMSV